MINRSKINDPRFMRRWRSSGSIGTIPKEERVRKGANPLEKGEAANIREVPGGMVSPSHCDVFMLIVLG